MPINANAMIGLDMMVCAARRDAAAPDSPMLMIFSPHLAISSAGRSAVAFLKKCLAAVAVAGSMAAAPAAAQDDLVIAESMVTQSTEIKNAQIREGSKVNHLSYIGDASVGEATNIGAGTITCNYDGYFKYKTEIGPRAFIGSNSALVAPVTIGQGATIGAGSVIGRDAPEGQLTLTRAKQVSLNWQRPKKRR